VAVALDHQAQVDQLMAEYRRSREQLVSVQRGLAAVTASATSHDELVTVTVGVHGTLTGLVIEQDAYRRYRPGELAELIVRTTEVAVARVVRRMHEELAPVLPSGADPDAILKGRGDLADIEVEPALVPPKPAEDDSFENRTWLSDGSKS
jgi:DNA-binding protein YbaB